jgi:transposase
MRKPELTVKHPSAIKQQLVALADTIPGAWIGIKIAAMLLMLEGQRPLWISEVLGITRMSLNRWIHVINKEGVEALKPKPKPGRPARIGNQVQKKLEQHLEQSPQEFGLNRVQWDGPTLVIHLKREFGISLKVRQAQKWMHQLGYRLKRAGYTYLQAKSEDAEKFRRKLKKTSAVGSEGNDCISR